MNRAALNTYIDTNVTNKTVADSLTPLDEGNALKAVADYVDQENLLDEKTLNKIIEITGNSEDSYTSEKAVVDYVASQVSGIQPYKKYVALLSQSGTSDPVVTTLLENTLSAIIVWTRISVGVYNGTLTGEFTNLRTWCSITPISVSGDWSLYPNDSNIVQIKTWNNGSNAFADSFLNETSIEIRVYN